MTTGIGCVVMPLLNLIQSIYPNQSHSLRLRVDVSTDVCRYNGLWCRGHGDLKVAPVAHNVCSETLSDIEPHTQCEVAKKTWEADVSILIGAREKKLLMLLSSVVVAMLANRWHLTYHLGSKLVRREVDKPGGGGGTLRPQEVVAMSLREQEL